MASAPEKVQTVPSSWARDPVKAAAEEEDMSSSSAAALTGSRAQEEGTVCTFSGADAMTVGVEKCRSAKTGICGLRFLFQQTRGTHKSGDYGHPSTLLLHVFAE